MEGVTASPHLREDEDEDVAQSVGESFTNLLGAQSHSSGSQDQKQPRLQTDGWEPLTPVENSLYLKFQDSNLSPTLSLLPVISEVQHNLTEFSLFHQSDTEFAPLRAHPDISMASGRFDIPPQDRTTPFSDRGSLSQHPLAQATILSEEGANSCFSLSQHSLSNQETQEVLGHPSMTDIRQELRSRGDRGSREKNSEIPGYPRDMRVGEAAEDETFFLSEDIPARHLLKLLQKEVGMQSSSSSPASSTSVTSVKSTALFTDEPKSTKISKLATNQSMIIRECPPGEAFLPQQHPKQPDRFSNTEQPHARHMSSEVSNISMSSRATQPGDVGEVLHRERLSGREQLNRLETQVKNKSSSSSLTQSLKEISEAKPSGIRTNMGGIRSTGPFLAGAEWVHREQDLWSPGNQTGVDGSYLGFLPQSQSTPGVFLAPTKSSVRAQFGKLSTIKSDRSSTGIAARPARSTSDAHQSVSQFKEDALQTSAEVRSLPSLSYMEKVDAWQANQNLGKTPLSDSLALPELSVMSAKKKAYGSVSDTPNQASSSQQSPVSGADNHNVAQISSTALSGPSPRRGEAVGGDKRGPAAPPAASPLGESQSFSSIKTVLMSAHKHQQTDMAQEKETSQCQDDTHHPPSITVKLSPLYDLGPFSDVSLDQDLRLSCSPDSYSGIKVGPSIGASSVVSLEIDNYAPYWTSKLSTPPPPFPVSQELNIDERIPLYLHNLGIKQSPSKILNPFVPRGPIREPEFSPTDLCTIQGSTGTPLKSTQPSDGGSPYKGECSRSSVLSVDSSVSIPFSLDSLGLAASVPEPARLRTFPPSDTEAVQTGGRLAPRSQADESPHPFTLQTSQQPQDNTQDISHIRDRSDPDLSLTTKASCVGRKSESLLRSKQHVDQGVEDSFVSTNAGSENIKEIKTQNSSLSSTSTAKGLRSHTSDLWTRSSSHSMPASEKKRQSSVGREVTSSSQQTDNPPIQAVPAAPTTVTFKTPQDRSVVNSKGTSVVLSKSVQRTEPEGCSAVPPDNAPAQLQAVTAPAAVSTQQLAAAAVTGPEEEDVNALSRSSSAIVEEGEEEDSSDGSSQSSLAVRVAKLLQKESPSTLVSSTPSITDQEEGRAIEWVKLKTSERCEPLELDLEDRKRIEEIKRELLLRNPLQSQGSTDTESSSGFSVKVHKEQNAPDSVETFSTLTDSNNRRGLSVSQPDSSARPQSFPPPDLEARVCEIADREGITLPAKKPQAFPSATFASCQRSASPLLCSSPVIPPSPGSSPLHLTELFAGTVRPAVANKQLSPNLDEKDRTTLVQQTTRTPSNVEWSGRSLTPQSVPATQKRQDTLGGRGEELPSPVCGLEEDMTGNQELSAQPSPVSGVDPVDQATAPSSAGNSTWTGLHSISNVHLSLSTEASSAVHSSHVDAVSEQPRGAFLPLRNSSAASSPDEGVGTSSPVENYEPREPGQSDASLKTVSQGRATARSLKSAVPPHRSDTSRPPTVPFAPVPVLLPYKPRGSDELFYVPQAEADVSSEEPSDTTVESSHTGSDDAVPPRFSSEVLGHQDPGLDRGITFRHAEGIYNKRMKTAFKMQQPEHRDVSAAGERSSPTVSRALKPVPLPRVSRRDQGTSPVQFPHHEPSEPGVHVHVEKVQTRVPQDRQRTSLSQPARQRSRSTLDQLWQKFCDRWTVEESHVARDRDAALVERLERLSRLIHGTRAAEGSPVQGQGDVQPPHKLGTERERREGREAYQERRRDEHSAAREVERIQLRLRAEKPLQPAESSRASLSSSVSHDSSQTSPAPGDQSETLSTTSMSTVDTERLIRAFGAHRVQRLSGSSSLSRLYSSINKQRGEGEWGGGGTDPRLLITPSGTTGTDEAVASDSGSSSTTYTVTSQRRPSRTVTAMKSLKLVNKSIQAGDLEIVSNGTRRNTRDVGTTFPSPGGARGLAQIPSSSSSGGSGRRGHRSPSKAPGHQKQRRNKRSPAKPYPEGVSWFISADTPRSEARKENRPEEPSAHTTTAWFEPYSRVGAWREPLRQRQVHQDRSREIRVQRQEEPDPDPGTKPMSSGLVPVSLREALELRRPEFISRSRGRMQRLSQQVEERKLQEVVNRERDELLLLQPMEPARLPRPAVAARLRRAVPRKEMIQRSKQIYEKLPEVQRRREEERRKAEYRSFRLNAQLYNKRITNRVLGRRTAWQ